MVKPPFDGSGPVAWVLSEELNEKAAGLGAQADDWAREVLVLRGFERRVDD